MYFCFRTKWYQFALISSAISKSLENPFVTSAKLISFALHFHQSAPCFQRQEPKIILASQKYKYDAIFELFILKLLNHKIFDSIVIYQEVYRRLSRHSPRATATSNPVLVFLAGTFLNLIRKLKIFGEEVHRATLFGFDLSQRVSLGKKLLQKLL